MKAGYKSPAVLLVAAIGGAGTMTVELSAVRLLAPWFGTSLAVWTNVIAVVLLALSVGYVLGGRLAGGERPLATLGIVLLLASPVVALGPALSGSVAGLFLPEGLALHQAADLVSWGSLAVSLILFLPAALLLGTVSPLAVQVLANDGGRSAGRAGGAVLSAGTVGSLAGVFGTSHFFLPVLGLDGTFALAAGTLALAGLLAFLVGRASTGAKVAGAAVLLFAGLSQWIPLIQPGLPAGQRLLAQGESPYQSVRVVEVGEGAERARYLQVNEGFDSFQSAWQPELGLFAQGFYYNDFALPPAWAGDAARPSWNVLVLGLGAGTTLRVMEGAAPAGSRMRFTGVELDPLVVEFAREHLDLPQDDERHRILSGVDARVALRSLDESFDQVVLDCYANQVEIPAHLATLEFFREIRAALNPEGWLVTNLGGFGFDDPVVRSVAVTCARAFEDDVLLLRVPFSRNFVLFARRGGDLPFTAQERARVPAELAGLVAPRELPGFVQRVSAEAADVDEPVLTDDRAPLARLQARSIAEAEARLRGEG